MFSFEFYNPVRVVFGAGAVDKTGVLVAGQGKRALLVSYREPGALRSVIDRVSALVEASGTKATLFLAVEENPDIAMVRDGAALCRSAEIDVVVGIGGGSAMDAAKAIAAAAVYDGDPWNMVYSRHDEVKAIPPTKALPLVQVTTLPATGSEMNQCAVVGDRTRKEKSYIWSECLYPKVAVIDPELTYGLPPFQTACAAADSISHVLEIYLNGADGTPLQHYFQEGVMRTTMENAPLALVQPRDADARTNLMWASTCAINGFASPGDAWTPMHQVGHVLTSLFGVNHGSSLSMLMPAWMRYFSYRRPERYLAFAKRVMDVDPAGKKDVVVITEGIDRFEAFLKGLGVPVRLGEKGITDKDVDAIVNGVAKVSFGKDGVLACNPPVTRQDLQLFLRSAL